MKEDSCDVFMGDILFEIFVFSHNSGLISLSPWHGTVNCVSLSSAVYIFVANKAILFWMGHFFLSIFWTSKVLSFSVFFENGSHISCFKQPWIKCLYSKNTADILKNGT